MDEPVAVSLGLPGLRPQHRELEIGTAAKSASLSFRHQVVKDKSRLNA